MSAEALTWISTFLLENKLLEVYFKAVVTEKYMTDFYPLVYSTNTYNNQEWARPKSGV